MCPYTLISSCLSPESWIIIKWSGRSSGSGFATPSHSANGGIVDLQQLRNGWINRVSFLFSIHYSPFSFLYSYGDSTGLTPDFPFNLPHEAGEPNQCKCKMPVQIWSKSYQQRGLLIFSLVFRVKALIERNGWCGSSLQLPFRFGKPSTENRLPGLIEYSEKFNRTLSFFIHFFLKHFFNNSAIMESAFLRLTANICLCFFKVGD